MQSTTNTHQTYKESCLYVQVTSTKEVELNLYSKINEYFCKNIKNIENVEPFEELEDFDEKKSVFVNYFGGYFFVESFDLTEDMVTELKQLIDKINLKFKQQLSLTEIYIDKQFAVTNTTTFKV